MELLVSTLATSAATGTALGLALLSAAALGFRHGLDYDHVAAITDIASGEGEPRRAMRLGLLYVFGHAVTVIALGSLALVAHEFLPDALDRTAGRVVGLTLLVLGIYVASTIFAHRHEEKFKPRSRAAMFADGALWLHWRLLRLFGSNQAQRQYAFRDGYGNQSSFVVGVIHGLGAETPTQILLFLLAANLGGTLYGILGILMFVAGLIVMNTVICASAAGLVRAGEHRPRLARWIAGATAAYSVALGAIFIVSP